MFEKDTDAFQFPYRVQTCKTDAGMAINVGVDSKN